MGEQAAQEATKTKLKQRGFQDLKVNQRRKGEGEMDRNM